MTIYNLGSINIDHSYRLTHFPRPGETISAHGFKLGLGGKGANQSVAAARAGSEVIHIGAIASGRDDWVLDQLSEFGVDTQHVARPKHWPTGHAIIMVDEAGENSIIQNGGANMRITESQLKRGLAGISAGDALLIQNETNLQVEAAIMARKAGARVIYSCAPFSVEAILNILPNVDILVLNELEASQLKEALDAPPNVEAMLVTLGAQGAEYRELSKGKTLQQPAYSVTAVDSTGAGDCFAGYFAAGLDQGRDTKDALLYASAAAAIKVSRQSTADAIPEAADVLDLVSGGTNVA